MVRLSRLILYWLPPILWMGLIFYLSSQYKVSVTGKFIFDFVFFKIIHMIEYAVLYFLFFRAFYSINPEPVQMRFKASNKFLFPLVISILYAFSDEIHQTLVPTREGKIRDIFIDTAGILLMYIYIKQNFRTIKKILQ